MWRDWDESSIERDLKLIRDLGFRVVRFFIKDEDFADNYGEVYPEALEKLGRFLDLLKEHGLVGFATFLVGHMSGRNWMIPWASPEKLYDPETIEKTAGFIRSIVERFRGHEAVGGWILSNELSLVKWPGSREEALNLLRVFSSVVKSIDKDHVVSSGDLVDSYMQETPNVRDLVDYVGPHLYLFEDDLVKQGFMFGALIEFFSNDGDIPVILEEFGFSTHQFSEESQARSINEVLYTALAHGASGAFIWCFSDFINETDPPYLWRPLELGYGIVRRDGSLKPSAYVVKRFSEEIRVLEDLGIHTRYIRRPETSIIIPFYMFRDYEFVWYRRGLGFWRSVHPLIASSIILSSAGLDNTMIYELDIDKSLRSKRLIVMPSVIVALTSTWRKLLSYVENGGGLYVSLLKGYGDLRAGYETATHLWSELMGVENMLEAGSIGFRRLGKIVIEFIRDFGEFRRGDRIEIFTEAPLYTYRARPVDAEILAVDESGEPVLLRAKRGSGKVYTMLIPFESTEAYATKMNWRGDLQRIYLSIAHELGIDPIYKLDTVEAEIKMFQGEESDILIIINHGDNKMIRLLSKREIKNVKRLGGDAELLTWSTYELEASFPRKSSLVLLVNR
jgi:endo-1,4-beta-mannosidase